MSKYRGRYGKDPTSVHVTRTLFMLMSSDPPTTLSDAKDVLDAAASRRVVGHVVALSSMMHFLRGFLFFLARGVDTCSKGQVFQHKKNMSITFFTTKFLW